MTIERDQSANVEEHGWDGDLESMLSGTGLDRTAVYTHSEPATCSEEGCEEGIAEAQ